MTELGSREVGGPSGVTRGEAPMRAGSVTVTATFSPGPAEPWPPVPPPPLKVKGHHHLTLPRAVLCTGSPRALASATKAPPPPQGARLSSSSVALVTRCPAGSGLSKLGSLQSPRQAAPSQRGGRFSLRPSPTARGPRAPPGLASCRESGRAKAPQAALLCSRGKRVSFCVSARTGPYSLQGPVPGGDTERA